MTVYVAGPMSNIEAFNYPAFDAAAEQWRAHGHDVLNPTSHGDGDTSLPYSFYIRKSIEDVLKADAVAVLPGWENSRGAKLEVAIAQALGLPILDAIGMEELR